MSLRTIVALCAVLANAAGVTAWVAVTIRMLIQGPSWDTPTWNGMIALIYVLISNIVLILLQDRMPRILRLISSNVVLIQNALLFGVSGIRVVSEFMYYHTLVLDWTPIEFGLLVAPLSAAACIAPRVTTPVKGQCVQCKYDCRGLSSSRCPECGYDNNDSDVDA